MSATTTDRSPGLWAITAVRIGVIYLIARAVTTGFLLLASALSGPESRHGVDPGLGGLTLGWDAQWYWLIAVQGYPSTLPLTPSGDVAENAWAFMPVYPYLSAAVGWVFGSWGAGAFVVSLVAGYLACLVFHRMLPGRMDGAASTWAVLLFAAAPLSVLFQLAYAESLFLLFVLVAILLVQERRFGWLYLVVPVMGYTRPGVLAFALFLGLYGIVRWVRRRSDALPLREIVHVIALGILAVVVGFSWQVIAGVVTGDPGAYLATELAWRRNWLAGETVFIPFDGWLRGGAFWFETWGFPAIAGVVVAIAIGLAVFAVLLFEPHVKRLGLEVRLWGFSYLLYLLVVFFPQSSVFRLLFPLSPLWAAVAQPRSPWWRAGVLAVALLGQWWWIWNMYGLGMTFWQIP